MSLLPIIYSSIVIFSGVLAFVLIVSYVSFKMKNSELIPLPAGNNKGKNSIQPQSININYRRAESKNNNFHITGKNLYGSKVSSALPITKSEYHRETKRVNKRKIEVIYKEKKIFSRSKVRNNEPRFSVIKNISNDISIEKNRETEKESPIKCEVTQYSNSSDLLRYYENF